MSRRYERDYDREPIYRRGERGEEDRERWRDYSRREDERNFWDRAGDEMRSWFGDEEAERRRRMDDMRYGRGSSNIGSEYYGRNYNRDYNRDNDREYNRDYNREYGRDTSQDWRRSRDYGRTGTDWDYGRQGAYGRPGAGMSRTGQGWTGRGEGGYDWATEDMGLEGRSSEWMSGLGTRQQGTTMRPQEGRFRGRGPRNYTRTDERIREDVIQQLTQHPDVDAYDIDVSVQNAEVTLSGTVENRRMKRAAEDIAEDVWGVKEVHNNIRVQSWEDREKGHRAA